MPTIELPIWLVIVAGLLAVWSLLDRLLLPSVRWLIRSRAQKVFDEVGARLSIQIRPFQQANRRALIDRLIFDDKVQHAMHAYAREHDMPREVALDQVRRYAREIVPAFNAYIYFRIGYWIAKNISRSIYRVRIGYTDDAGLAGVPENATVVFVMNHRSNMDYILASYLAAEKAALSYAVGEWARIWPLQQLIRSMGAYFVRRNSKDDLYRRVLERYISMATEAGVTQAMYPEGGLSRDGRMREPRFGVLDYMLRGFHVRGERDLVFVPVGLNYDRTLEDRTLLLSADQDRRGPGSLGALANTLAFAGNQLWLVLRSRWHRFGYACVNFGTPVSIKHYCEARGLDFARLDRAARLAEVATLGRHLMSEIGKLIPVLPVPLVSTVLLQRVGSPISELELKSSVALLVQRLEAGGARIYVPRSDWDYAVTAGLRMLTQRHLVEVRDGLFVAIENEVSLLRYYANSIAHLI
ncbi:MAG: 1-acyl-sn-glycerol-3-phosphate acyltransferase [Burkholderiales bacterium]